jgi:hypothetical protein
MDFKDKPALKAILNLSESVFVPKNCDLCPFKQATSDKSENAFDICCLIPPRKIEGNRPHCNAKQWKLRALKELGVWQPTDDEMYKMGLRPKKYKIYEKRPDGSLHRKERISFDTLEGANYFLNSLNDVIDRDKVLVLADY